LAIRDEDDNDKIPKNGMLGLGNVSLYDVYTKKGTDLFVELYKNK
jgi:hypothetical protein